MIYIIYLLLLYMLFIKSEYDFVVFGSDTCPYCLKAYSLLESNNIQYKYIDINGQILSKQDIFKDLYLNRLIPSSVKTIPIIFYKGRYIGGYTDLRKMLSPLTDDF